MPRAHDAMLHHRLWNRYLLNLQQRPMIVKACTSCLTFSATDCIAQSRERSKARSAGLPVPRHDAFQSARNGAFGLLWLGPLNHIFWGRSRFGLEYWIPGQSWSCVFRRVAVDQITNMPLNMVVFLAWPHLWRGDFKQARADVQAYFWPSFTFALSIWPFVHPLSFKYVPLEHRLLVLNICSLFVFSYATYVSDRQSKMGPVRA